MYTQTLNFYRWNHFCCLYYFLLLSLLVLFHGLFFMRECPSHVDNNKNNTEHESYLLLLLAWSFRVFFFFSSSFSTFYDMWFEWLVGPFAPSLNFEWFRNKMTIKCLNEPLTIEPSKNNCVSLLIYDGIQLQGSIQYWSRLCAEQKKEQPRTIPMHWFFQ